MLTELEVFAKRLRQARIKEKLSMDALCEKVEGVVSKQAISKYEAAKMMPSSPVLIAPSKYAFKRKQSIILKSKKS